MTVINTNTASMVARDAIQKNNRDMSTAMERDCLQAHELTLPKTMRQA